MSKVIVTESEVEAVEKLRAKGECTTSLAMTQELLSRRPDDATRMRLLFNILYCSTRLELNDLTDAAIRDLEELPEPEMSRIFVDLIRANSAIDLGRPQDALFLIDHNLQTAYMQRDDFRIHRYDHFAAKGEALKRLSQYSEALDWLVQAQGLYSSEKDTANRVDYLHVRWMTNEILRDKAFCLLDLKRFDEAYEVADELREREEGDMKTLALRYMAYCKVSQGKYADALKLYQNVQERLPSRLVDAARIQDEVQICMDALGKMASHQ